MVVRASRSGGAAGIAMLAVAAALGAAARSERPSPARAAAIGGTFLSGAVGWALPQGWRVQGLVADAGCEGLAAYIPCPALDATPHSANANLLAEPNPDRIDLATWSGRRLGVAAPRRVVQERVEGAWRTVISTGEDRGARYVVVERFGVSPRARVHAVAAFPELPGMGEDWFARTGAEIDRFLGALSLADAPPSAVHVGWDRGDVRLAIER
jgi:hypothetical protein